MDVCFVVILFHFELYLEVLALMKSYRNAFAGLF